VKGWTAASNIDLPLLEHFSPIPPTFSQTAHGLFSSFSRLSPRSLISTWRWPHSHENPEIGKLSVCPLYLGMAQPTVFWKLHPVGKANCQIPLVLSSSAGKLQYSWFTLYHCFTPTWLFHHTDLAESPMCPKPLAIPKGGKDAVRHYRDPSSSETCSLLSPWEPCLWQWPGRYTVVLGQAGARKGKEQSINSLASSGLFLRT
jgi:hypothetical protein